MIFTELDLPGAFLIEPEAHHDPRGFFARTWCVNEFAAHGLNTQLVQCNISWNATRGTLRGMHYQIDPYCEVKFVRCTTGAIYDVLIDLRPESPAYMRWVATELSAKNRRALYVPCGCAHGFQTLVDDTEVFYQMSEFYAPDYARGVRWNDPAFDVSWPIEQPSMSVRDSSFADYQP